MPVLSELADHMGGHELKPWIENAKKRLCVHRQGIRRAVIDY